jgi:hypothetical protein
MAAAARMLRRTWTSPPVAPVVVVFFLDIARFGDRMGKKESESSTRTRLCDERGLLAYD